MSMFLFPISVGHKNSAKMFKIYWYGYAGQVQQSLVHLGRNDWKSRDNWKEIAL